MARKQSEPSLLIDVFLSDCPFLCPRNEIPFEMSIHIFLCFHGCNKAFRSPTNWNNRHRPFIMGQARVHDPSWPSANLCLARGSWFVRWNGCFMPRNKGLRHAIALVFPRWYDRSYFGERAWVTLHFDLRPRGTNRIIQYVSFGSMGSRGVYPLWREIIQVRSDVLRYVLLKPSPEEGVIYVPLSLHRQ